MKSIMTMRHAIAAAVSLLALVSIALGARPHPAVSGASDAVVYPAVRNAPAPAAAPLTRRG